MPVVAGALLDLLDLATWGPVGLWVGLAAGGLAGWMLAPLLGWQGRSRWLGALGAGLYCMLPVTSILPLGTVVGLLSSLRERKAPEVDSEELGDSRAGPAIEADYTARWDPPER